jgi:hypothetical protein
MRASPRTQAADQATLQQWKDAYSQQNLDGALAVITPDDDVVGIGTGPAPRRVAHADATRRRAGFNAIRSTLTAQDGHAAADAEKRVASTARRASIRTTRLKPYDSGQSRLRLLMMVSPL